jgi:hypothetical protein
MVKKFTYSCDFAGKKYPVTFYIGDAAKGEHPIAFQSNWLSKEKGGVVPKDLMESLEKLKEISDNSKVPFEELCEYVIQEIKLLNPGDKKATTKASPKKSNFK